MQGTQSMLFVELIIWWQPQWKFKGQHPGLATRKAL